MSINSNNGISVKNKQHNFLIIDKPSINFYYEAIVDSIYKTYDVQIKVEWEDQKNNLCSESFVVNINNEKNEINWEELKYEKPYSLEYVQSEDELVGRTEILNKIYSSLTGTRVSSSFIFGQKRVGKTSIAKVILSKLNKSTKNKYITIYIETGEFLNTSSDISKTINDLAWKICRMIQSKDSRLSSITIPNFDGSFSKINEFLDEITYIDDEIKIIIVLDEFDEINPILYLRGEIGDSFFLTIRAISNKPQFAFLLIGGEKMPIILSAQGEQINKFIPVQVDYFDKQKEYADFVDLVRKPAPYLLYEDNAIDLLHSYTAGNPFYAKIICKQLFEIVVNRNDNHITESEMQEAIDISLSNESINSFMHFWDDGIREKGIQEEMISIRRRKVLLSIAESSIKRKSTSQNDVIKEAINKGLNDIQAKGILSEFVERQILEINSGSYTFKIRYFEEWLTKYGISKIITSFTDQEQKEEWERKLEESKVSSSEIVDLVKKWSTYQGQEVTTEKVKSWLSQFGDNVNQRLMFTLLCNIRFYDDYLITTKLSEVYKRIKRSILSSEQSIEEGLTMDKLEKSIRTNKILLSYLDQVGKSSAEYARLFAETNDIFYKNIVEKNKINEHIKSNTEITDIIFIDDFIGTGSTIREHLVEFIDNFGVVIKERVIRIHIGVISGYLGAKSQLEEDLNLKGIKASIYIGDPLTETEKCFKESSNFYNSHEDWLGAKKICYEKGANLEKKHPLGFGDCQSLVVFSKTCPNNSLPILWKKTSDWEPLFERR